jgi:DNA (cytosine-5)-methyltransferase 1
MIEKPSCAWNLTDLKAVPQNGLTVMSTFACGGGSSMGYKRAGCTIVAANDIDPEMAWHYRQNLKPPRYYLCPIRDLLTMDLPDELFALDILDGSPPCSTFSMAGSREDSWGKEKHFREGQAKQVLSDLFFDFLDVVERLRPRVAVAENVKGMIIGNAKGYTKLVAERFRQIGYRPQLFLLSAADCGAPQKRERVFFCAVREDVSDKELILKPKHRWISVGEACADIQHLTAEEVLHTAPADFDRKCWHRTKPGKSYADFVKRSENRCSGFNMVRLDQSMPSCTLTASDPTRHWKECRTLTFREYKRLGSFPDDYVAKDD